MPNPNPPPNGENTYLSFSAMMKSWPNVNVREGISLAKITLHRTNLALSVLKKRGGCQEAVTRLEGVKERLEEVWIPELEQREKEWLCAEKEAPGSGMFTWLSGTLPFQGDELAYDASVTETTLDDTLSGNGRSTAFTPEYLAPDYYLYQCFPNEYDADNESWDSQDLQDATNYFTAFPDNLWHFNLFPEECKDPEAGTTQTKSPTSTKSSALPIVLGVGVGALALVMLMRK